MNKYTDKRCGVQHATAETIKHNVTSDTSLTLPPPPPPTSQKLTTCLFFGATKQIQSTEASKN